MREVTAISYHDTVKDLQGLSWLSESPFTRLEWFQLLENAGHKPLIALAQDGKDATALALTERADGIEILTNWYAFTWAAMRANSARAEALLSDLASDLRRYGSVVLSKLPEEDGTCAALEIAFSEAGWRTFLEPCDVNHYLIVAGRSYAEYLAARPGQLRTTIKRKAKLVDITLSHTFSADDWQAYAAIYAESWKPEEGDPAMLRAFAEQEAAAGRMRFGLARHEGEPVAAQFWTVENGKAYIHKLAHRENAKHLSAGTSLSAALFEQVIDIDKVREVDFGTGDDAYKRDWMEAVRQRNTLTCLRPEKPQNWPKIAKRSLRKLVTKARNG